MIGYTYDYKNFSEILSPISKLQELELISIGGTIGVAIFTLILTFFIFPTLILLFENHKREQSKKNKKNLLNQILLQKELEDEIEKEIKKQQK